MKNIKRSETFLMLILGTKISDQPPAMINGEMFAFILLLSFPYFRLYIIILLSFFIVLAFYYLKICLTII